jgi:hypothetical protein
MSSLMRCQFTTEGKLSIHDISDEDKLDAEARLFYLFEEKPVWTKKSC